VVGEQVAAGRVDSMDWRGGDLGAGHLASDLPFLEMLTLSD
jgi:hypothetical protein